MVKRIKLSKREVKAYEKLSGFKTTGNVELHIIDNKTYNLIENLITKKT